MQIFPLCIVLHILGSQFTKYEKAKKKKEGEHKCTRYGKSKDAKWSS